MQYHQSAAVADLATHTQPDSMKTIGLLGGMSWESTLSYYKAINEGVRQQRGGLSSAKICLYSVDFEEIEKLQHAGNWPQTAQILTHAAQAVERGGADFLLICTNTMHKVAPQILSHCYTLPMPPLSNWWPMALLRLGCWVRALPWSKIFIFPA